MYLVLLGFRVSAHGAMRRHGLVALTGHRVQGSELSDVEEDMVFFEFVSLPSA